MPLENGLGYFPSFFFFFPFLLMFSFSLFFFCLPFTSVVQLDLLFENHPLLGERGCNPPVRSPQRFGEAYFVAVLNRYNLPLGVPLGMPLGVRCLGNALGMSWECP